MAWKSPTDMSALERKMHWAVREETMLHELPWPEVNHGSPPELVPAQPPDECSRVLVEWFDQGLLTVMDTATQANLPDSDARALLTDPPSWTPDHSLVLTDVDESSLLQ